MTRILLIRHASAGNRKNWDGDDRMRPLDEQGRRQAVALPELLADYPVKRLLSSPYVRCVDTLGPLAEHLFIPLEIRPELAEGAHADNVASLLADVHEKNVALCTHGDVVEDLLGEESPKGSVWVLRLADGALRRERYLPPG